MHLKKIALQNFKNISQEELALGLHYLYRTQAAPWQCPNKFGIALGLHYL
mgnify:CR=1 FL=1